MLSYRQRFLRYHNFLSNLTEDILATTILLPITTVLYAWNILTEMLSNFSILPHQTDRRLWLAGQRILTVPLFILNGVFSLFIHPILAAFCALSEKTPPKTKLLASQIYNTNWGSLTIPIVSMFFMGWYAVYLFLFFLVCSSLLPRFSFFTFFFGNTVGILLGLTSYLIGLPSMVLTMSPMALVTLGVVASLSFMEGKFNFFSQKLGSLIDKCITLGQNILRVFGMNPYRNNEDIDDAVINTLSDQDLFISNSNHAFQLASLQANLERGLENYFIPRDGQPMTRLDQEDVQRLAHHPQIRRFPQLQQYILAHQQEFRNIDGVSAQTITVLRNLASALIAPVTQENFNAQLIAAHEAYERHLATLPEAERTRILNANIIGGNNPEYRLESALNHVFLGEENERGWCKHSVGTATQEMVNHWDKKGTLEPSKFWQREEATPIPMGFGRI